MKKEFYPKCIICFTDIESSKLKATTCPRCRDLIEKEKKRLMPLITKRAKYNVWKNLGKPIG